MQFPSDLDPEEADKLHYYGAEGYKIVNRDWEMIIRGTYPFGSKRIPFHDDQGPFFQDIDKTLPNRDQLMEKAIQNGYARFWNYFLNLILYQIE